MRSPASAIAWEIWRKNRWGFWVVLGSFLCGLVVRFFEPLKDEGLKFIAGTTMVVCFVVTFAIFSFAESGVQMSFPTRAFALPVRTKLLVNCPIVLGVVGITLVHLAWAFLFLLPLDARYPLGSFTIYWAAALLTFQALLWCLANYPKSFVVVLVLAIALFVRLAVVLVENDDAMRAIVCLLMILPVAYLCAGLGIRQQRRGQWQIPAKAQLLMEAATGKLLLRKRPFATPAQAQLWMEWQRNAVAPLISLGIGLVIVCAGFVHLAALDDVGSITSAWSYIVCALLTLWACISGVLMARDASSKSLALSSFLATRPVTSGELAFAKIKLAGQVTLAGWLIYAIALFFWFNFFGAHPGLPIVGRDDVSIPTMGFVALALAWHLVGALPLWLTGRIESTAWVGLLLLGGYIALGNGIQFLDKHFGLLVVLSWLFTFGLIAQILIAVWAFREANREQLLSPRATVKYFVFWLADKKHEIASSLSRGMLQKLSLACAFLREPRVIILDEPLTGLDPRSIRNIKQSIRRRATAGTAFLLSSHLLGLVEALCDQVFILHDGQRVAFGSLAEIRGLATVHADASLEEVFFAVTEGP